MAHILIIDDNAVGVTMLTDYLEHAGHSVSSAQDGISGLRKLQTEKFDLVLLDWKMPGKDGIDVLKTLRADDQITPVIMLTGQTSVDEKEFGLDCGANDYLTKPFHLKELGARIRAMLKRQALIKAPPRPLGQGNEDVLKTANLAGTSLAAKYEFIELLGKGAFGLVFKARHPYLQKMVAVKMVQSDNLTDEVINRFHVEARAASRLNHPNVVVVHDFGVTEHDQPFMVMELVEGQGLDQVLHEKFYLPFAVAGPLFIDVCEGIAHAHELAVVHRDLKPSNIMVKHGKNDVLAAKIVDFGLAQFATTKPRNSAGKGYFMGSPLYAPPETLRGDSVDHRADIYSFGCTMFEVLTGSMPIDGRDLNEIIYNHVMERPLRLRQARPDLSFPQGLQEVLDKALQKAPHDRYESAQEMCAALRDVARS